MKSPVNIKQQVDVCFGRAGTHIGGLTYVKQGKRENTAFAYTPAWLANPDAFSQCPTGGWWPAMRPWTCRAMSWTTSPQRSSMRNWTPHASYWGEKAE